jgi:hypothetical protein
MGFLLGKNRHLKGKRVLERYFLAPYPLTHGYKILNINLARKHDLGFNHPSLLTI